MDYEFVIHVIEIEILAGHKRGLDVVAAEL
jgi:hypothetical protein